MRLKRGIGTVLKGNRRSLSTPVNASKSGPGFYCAPRERGFAKKRDGDLLIYLALDGRYSRENRCFFVGFDPLRF